MMAPFEPKGDQARWKTIYDLILQVPVGSVLTYEAMGDALNLDASDERHTIQMAMRRAARELETHDKRAVEVIANEGYRVVHAGEQLRLARVQQKKAGKALKRGHSKVINVDFNQVDPESRKAFEVVAQAFALQMEFNHKMDIRQKRLEQVINAVEERTERTESELDELRARMARLEQREED